MCICICRCSLNPATGFIWALIIPALVITSTNVAFLVMAGVVLWRHKKKQTGKMSAKDARNWLLTLVSLVVILGLNWIFGVVIYEAEELLALAYIFTLSVSFQGVWIFLLFVVLDRKVREGYAKLWRRVVLHSPLFSSSKEVSQTVIMI